MNIYLNLDNRTLSPTETRAKLLWMGRTIYQVLTFATGSSVVMTGYLFFRGTKKVLDCAFLTTLLTITWYGMNCFKEVIDYDDQQKLIENTRGK